MDKGIIGLQQLIVPIFNTMVVIGSARILDFHFVAVVSIAPVISIFPPSSLGLSLFTSAQHSLIVGPSLLSYKQLTILDHISSFALT